MPDVPDENEGQAAWNADLGEGGNPGELEPSESDGTYRLAKEAPTRRPLTSMTPKPVVEPLPPRRIASKNSGDRLALAGYNLLIFLTSVCVMTLELTASRIIGKHLGASIYTWTSVIGVILAGITLGNWLGGWLADRYDRNRALGWMYLLSSISSAGVLLLEQMVDKLDRPESFSWPFWVLTVVALLFLLPAMALGATSPLIAALALSRSNRLGSTVGNVYAWGACGSIVGTFLTGFYLVDVLGSRAIVGLIAISLAVLAATMAAKRRIFRTVVLVGWLQLFLFTWSAASATETSWGGALDRFAAVTGFLRSDDGGVRRAAWYRFGSNVGLKLHELGLVLRLRDDQIGRYYDESRYSYIHVAEGRQNGVPVKILRLDKLIHSFYDPAEPTALHYDYEEIYAAVTKTAVADRQETLSTKVPDFAEWDDIREQLPAAAQFEEASRTLTLDRIDAELTERLLRLAPDADYWFAVNQLASATTRPGWGGMEAYTLDGLPPEVSIPEDLAGKIRFDNRLRLLTAYAPVTPELHQRLIDLSPRSPWYWAILNLRGQAGQISAFFIGGGGYIFPRWLASEFPGTNRIDVAELDPAVREAVVAELGLTPEDEARITTIIGDARQVVDERLKENRQRIARNEPPITYDFIYGDAFNDFSVPWHLTTLEFQRKLKELLSPDGVLQVNLIDVYPRAEYPGRPLGHAEIAYDNFLPPGLMKDPVFPPNQFIAVRPKFGPIEVQMLAAGKYRLRTSRILDDRYRDQLLSLDPQNSIWTKAVDKLVDETRHSEPFPGQVPAALIPAQQSPYVWMSAPEPFAAFELQPTESGQYVLGYRGAMSDDARRKLSELDPQNAAWQTALTELQQATRKTQAGQFLSRYVYTASLAFPNVYVFSTSTNIALRTNRDTFIIVCSLEPMDLTRLDRTDYWSGQPFATLETTGAEAAVTLSGHMGALLEMARGQALTDDFAPVDNLLLPIFARH